MGISGTLRRPSLVGTLLRTKREAAGLSQRALAQLFQPPVTTQFISNVERGVTPLPACHVALVARVLKLSEQELMDVMTQEFNQRLSGKLGTPAVGPPVPEVLKKLYSAYLAAPPGKRDEFVALCESMLGIPRSDWD